MDNLEWWKIGRVRSIVDTKMLIINIYLNFDDMRKLYSLILKWVDRILKVASSNYSTNFKRPY